MNIEKNNLLQSAVFGGGCFWCTEAIFLGLRGVQSVMPGYSGGRVEDPTYEQVSLGNTGHAEAIKVEFDPEEINYRDLLEVFFSTHDPTTLNKQGNDVGEQYRSVVFYTNEEQKKETEEFVNELENDKVFNSPIVTEITPFQKFYEAEGYHKNYFERNRNNPYCMVIINPKLEKFKKKFVSLMKPK
ncbi:MAG: peptide-methionine (S)-S-oxide reductase MsrA [Candidatus Doudnabacteria bacterium]|nr:peptide-methionine (S)-S-oxide reductase MsrA [Candidatus Doudnabacteria bacterium]